MTAPAIVNTNHYSHHHQHPRHSQRVNKGLPSKSAIDKCEEAKRRKLQVLRSRLAQNALNEFKLGFDIGEIKSKGDTQAILRTIEQSYMHQVALDKVSSLESIRIGWQLPRTAYGPILEAALPKLLQPPVRVRFMELSLNIPVPLSTLQQLVSCHTLETLVLRSVKVRVPAAQPTSRHAASQSRGADRLALCQSRPDEFSFDDENIVAVVPFLSQSIHSLKLTDCGFQNHHMRALVRSLRAKRNLRCLSLRQNPELRVDGWEKEIFASLPFLEHLDLSLCDLDPLDGLALARTIKQFPSVSDPTQHETAYDGLKGLNLAGNYRLGPTVFSIVEACEKHGVSFLNCSFCEIESKTQQQIFKSLATTRPCSLQMLVMQGVRIKDVQSLLQCVQQNASLKKLILDHPREPFPISTFSLIDIKDALKKNYHLQDIRVDHWCQDKNLLREIQHELKLNQLGRGILDNEPHLNWSQVLSNVSRENDTDLLYWFLRNGVSARLFQDVTQQQPESPPTKATTTGTAQKGSVQV
eukprot:Nitzschia sp. Nitz4//scaffold143_size57137//9814//11388//NITZ4_006508-RA/size57137-processed-gene-0.46-mRNA-1//-1//CDS//3329536428//1979//frame0